METDALALVGRLHSRILRLVAEQRGLHCSGLHQVANLIWRSNAPCQPSKPTRLIRKLKHLDAAYGVMRHITSVSCDDLYEEVLNALKKDAGGNSSAAHFAPRTREQASQATFADDTRRAKKVRYGGVDSLEDAEPLTLHETLPCRTGSIEDDSSHLHKLRVLEAKIKEMVTFNMQVLKDPYLPSIVDRTETTVREIHAQVDLFRQVQGMSCHRQGFDDLVGKVDAQATLASKSSDPSVGYENIRGALAQTLVDLGLLQLQEVRLLITKASINQHH